AASRTFCTAGSRRPMSTAMMAITTNSSMSVNADRRREEGRTTDLPWDEGRAGAEDRPTSDQGPGNRKQPQRKGDHVRVSDKSARTPGGPCQPKCGEPLECVLRLTVRGLHPGGTRPRFGAGGASLPRRDFSPRGRRVFARMSPGAIRVIPYPVEE